MYEDVITIFNYHKASDSWYISVVEGVHISGTTGSSKTMQGYDNSTMISVIVPCKRDKTIRTSSGDKGYLSPKEYANCDAPESHFTFRYDSDFIYAGEWEDLTPVDESDYESGYYYELNDALDEIYKINTSAFYKLLPDFELEGV